MALAKYIAIRLAITAVQAAAITAVVFVLLRALPGDPAFLLAGPNPTEGRLEAIRESLRLNDPITTQFSTYVGNLVGGDWGRSINTNQNVLHDILDRAPATFELVTLAMIAAVLVALPWAAWSARHPKSFAATAGLLYGRTAGALPDFWVALLLVLVFYAFLHVVPAPLGRLGVLEAPPAQVTGLLLIDSLLSGRVDLFASALAHLALPVAALTIVAASVFYRQARAGLEHELGTSRVLFARACGLPEALIMRRSLRNAIAPVLGVVGTTYAYMLGGAVLIESIFSWGGLGQYAVDAVRSSDYYAISGIVLVTSMLALLVYLAVDVATVLLDPRLRS